MNVKPVIARHPNRAFVQPYNSLMISRDELKSMIDRVPEDRLKAVQGMLDFHISPPPPIPQVERMRQRGDEYRRIVEQRFRETRKLGTVGVGGGFGGGGFSGMHEGEPYGRHSFGYWDEGALVEQVLQSFDGQDIEIMERFSLSPDRTKLFCQLELSSAGYTVRHSDEFPVSRPAAGNAASEPVQNL